ncbi:MAG: cytochrome P450 [Acidimicrobiia bacterium]|nr:cytochrome P450 [Acidimicrobiia bacterium]
MVNATSSAATQTLTLVDEFILTLLNEEAGYFHQVPGWDLNCAVAGAALGELSLRSRIDTDVESLNLLDDTPTGDAALDPILEKIAAEPARHSAQYWVERLAIRSESIIDATLERLVNLKVLEHHDGEFWTLARAGWQTNLRGQADEETAAEFVKTRISRAIFGEELPDPRDAIIISLAKTCDVLRIIFQLDDEAAARVEYLCKIDLIGRAIADAISGSIAGPLLRRSTFAKSIPVVSLVRILRSPHVRSGNLPALFASLAERYGPVFQIKVPFVQRMIFLCGPRTNRWAHRHGRMYLRARDYLEEFEKVYGGVGILPTLDGADHFRYRKTIQPAYSRSRLEAELSTLCDHARRHMATWSVGESRSAVPMCRKLVNSEMSPLTVSIDSQDVVDDLHTFKERALKTHIGRTMPKFMLRTPAMKRRAKLIDEVVTRVQRVHTPAQRAGCPRNLADDLLSMHANDCQLLPESNLRFVLTAPLIASMYVGDQLSFIIHALLARPELYELVRAEADALFTGGDPDHETVNGPATDVTRRVIMEAMRMYPIVPMSIRNVMNATVVEGYELPEGARVFIVQTATHYMSDLFPDPFNFDIDRYKPPRKEHLGIGYAPYGLGTHVCLGSRWTEMQLALNLLLVLHYFTLEIAPTNYKFKIDPVPSMSPSKKLQFKIVEQRHELPV